MPIETNSIFTIQAIDLCHQHNGKHHRTDKFHHMQSENITKLVVRRGQFFRIKLRTNRIYMEDNIIFTFKLCQDIDNNEVPIVVTSEFNNPSHGINEWKCSIHEVTKDYLTVLVRPSAGAQIGEWQISVNVEVETANDGSPPFECPSSILVLFNPWCFDDQVYMADKQLLDEYVLADTTLIWRGTYNNHQASPWKLGQYERDILDCSLALITTVGQVSAEVCGDPIAVSRALSAAVNAPDDGGVVEGNWSNSFAGGTPPSRWTGSAPILQEFYANRRPVKYGQCWVFGAVLTTIARAIGLPARVVTNFESGHEATAKQSSTLTIDCFVDAEGNKLKSLNRDSIWNYHVWTEMWMDRPDLKQVELVEGGYGGWQVVDPTPQERSAGMYRCGPAPVLAIKLGDVKRSYDCDFVFSEVNADKVVWRYMGEEEPLELLSRDTTVVGQAISTKAAGRWEREDLTGAYKFAERSCDERDTMRSALELCETEVSRQYLDQNFGKIVFKLHVLEDVQIGQSFKVALRMQNQSGTGCTVSGVLRVHSVQYNGQTNQQIKFKKFTHDLPGKSSSVVEMIVDFNEYHKYVFEQGLFNISTIASVQDTEIQYYAEDDFRICKPNILIEMDGAPKALQNIQVKISLKNPLNISMTDCVFCVEGPGIKPVVRKFEKVGVECSAEFTFEYTPPWAGKDSLMAKLHCNEMSDVDGYLNYNVDVHDELENSLRNEIARTLLID